MSTSAKVTKVIATGSVVAAFFSQIGCAAAPGETGQLSLREKEVAYQHQVFKQHDDHTLAVDPSAEENRKSKH